MFFSIISLIAIQQHTSDVPVKWLSTQSSVKHMLPPPVIPYLQLTLSATVTRGLLLLCFIKVLRNRWIIKSQLVWASHTGIYYICTGRHGTHISSHTSDFLAAGAGGEPEFCLPSSSLRFCRGSRRPWSVSATGPCQIQMLFYSEPYSHPALHCWNVGDSY